MPVDQAHRVLGGQHAGDGAGGEFPHAVPGRDGGLVARVAQTAEQGFRGRECGGDQQRLGYRGVGDLLGARRRAAGDQVTSGEVGPGGQAVGDAGQVQPGRQKAGGLRALPWGSDNEHPSTLHCRSPPGG